MVRSGPTGMEGIYQNLYATFPNSRWEIQALFGEDDWVALHVIQTGTHQGKPSLPVFGGLIHTVEPTGRPVSVPNIHLYQMKDGLIVKHVAVRDDWGMMQQMGLLPQVFHAVGRHLLTSCYVVNTPAWKGASDTTACPS